MKNILKLIFGFLISLFTILSVVGIVYYYSTSSKFLLNIAKNTNYYENATKEIKEHLKQRVINEELKSCIDDFVTEEKVTNDINAMIDSLYKNNDIKSIVEDTMKKEIKEIIVLKLDGKDYDENALNDLINSLGSSYINDIFPYTEYYKLKSNLISIEYLLPMSVFFIIMTCLCILLSILINKEKSFEILYKANFFTGILLVFPCCLCHLYGLFKNFYYSNVYFSLYIKKTFYSIIDLLGIIGLVILIITIVLELIVIKPKNK